MLIYLDYTFPTNEEEQDRYSSLKKTALLNSSICMLKAREFREAISLASQVINEFPDAAQAYYCKGKAHREIGEFAEAKEFLSLCQKLQPRNAEALFELKVLESDIQLYKHQEKEFARDVFGRKPDEETVREKSGLIYQ